MEPAIEPRFLSRCTRCGYGSRDRHHLGCLYASSGYCPQCHGYLSFANVPVGAAGAAYPLRLQRRRQKGWRMPANAVYVGRPTKWGNPFVVADDPAQLASYKAYTANVDLWVGWPVKDAATAVQAFEAMKMETLRPAAIRELRGKTLVCWCPLDRPCHGDVLLRVANAS